MGQQVGGGGISGMLRPCCISAFWGEVKIFQFNLSAERFAPPPKKKNLVLIQELWVGSQIVWDFRDPPQKNKIKDNPIPNFRGWWTKGEERCRRVFNWGANQLMPPQKWSKPWQMERSGNKNKSSLITKWGVRMMGWGEDRNLSLLNSKSAWFVTGADKTRGPECGHHVRGPAGQWRKASKAGVSRRDMSGEEQGSLGFKQLRESEPTRSSAWSTQRLWESP